MKSTRREFLALAAAPALVRLQDKSGSKPPILGSGAHTYEAIHDWGTLPAHIKWGNTHAVVEDAQGHIHVHHTVHATSQSPDTVVVFDRAGRFVRSWGAQFRGVAHGLQIRRERSSEFLYLTVNATNPRLAVQPGTQAAVVKTTLTGEIVWTIQGPPDVPQYTQPNPDGSAKRYNPTNLAIAPNGDVYVGDGYGSYFVNQYDRNGKYIRTFGGRGSEAGQLNEPHGIWIDTRGDRGSGIGDRGSGIGDRGSGNPGRRRPSQQPAAAVHAGRHPRRLHLRIPAAVSFRRTTGIRCRPRSTWPRDADGSRQSDRPASRRLERAGLE